MPAWENSKQCYSSFQNQKHKNFIISDSGLFISTDFPYLGASPDGLIGCECCGAGACEIKVIKKIMIIILMIKILLKQLY